MSAFTQAAGAGETRPPAAPSTGPIRGTTFLLVAAWILLAEGGVGLIFLPVLIFSAGENIPPGQIAGFALGSVALLAAGGLLFSRWRWTWWIALAVPIVAAAWLWSIGGLTSQAEGTAAAAFAAVEVVLLVLGRGSAGHPNAMAIASARIPFRVKLMIVWISIFLLLVLLFALMKFDVAWMRQNASFVFKGLTWTILLSLGAIVLATVLALFGALGRLSRNPVAYGISGFYTSFFRGTPLIVQLFLIYLALPQIGRNMESTSLLNILTLTSFQAGLIGLGLNYGAYMTEIFRAGIQSVGHGQAEAADALGMRYAQRMRRVVLPQATRVIIPPTGNEFIAMMKDTALVSVLGAEIARAEVFRRASLVGAQDYKNLESLILAAGLYWGLTAIFTVFQRRLERRMSKGYVRTEARQATGQKRFQFLPGHAGGMGGGGGGVVITGEDDDAETEGML